MDITSITATVDAIDLSTITAAAIKREHLPSERAPAAETAYRQFLALAAAYPQKVICVPSDADKIWHQHILSTAKYAKDCAALCGRPINHDANAFGTPKFAAAWADTVALYKDHFGVALDADPTALDQTALSAANCYRDPQDDLPDELPPAVTAH